MIVLIVLFVLIVIKMVWILLATWGNGSLESERKDLCMRREYLLDKIATTPRQLIDEMPKAVGLGLYCWKGEGQMRWDGLCWEKPTHH